MLSWRIGRWLRTACSHTSLVGFYCQLNPARFLESPKDLTILELPVSNVQIEWVFFRWFFGDTELAYAVAQSQFSILFRRDIFHRRPEHRNFGVAIAGHPSAIFPRPPI